MKLLVVDASDGGARLVQFAEDLGHCAELEADLAAAKGRVSTEPFDVLLVDWSCDPRGSIAELRVAAGAEPWMLVIAADADAARALGEGADDCVAPPIVPDALCLRLMVAERALAVRRDGATTETELRETLELNRRITEAIPGGIVHVRSDGSIVTANAEALRVLGMSYDELTRRYVSDFDTETIHEDGSPCPHDHYPVSLALSTGERQPPHTIGVRRSDGQTSWALFTAVPVKDPESGATSGAIVTFLDLTARKAAEERLRALETQLQQTQKLESLGVLAGGIAHDFNNLLAAILGNASLARLQIDGQPRLQESLAAIETATERAADLTQQMLAYSGRGKRSVRPVRLSDAVREMTELLSTVISKKAALHCDFAEDLPLIEADPGQLQQVVMNLIINASDAIGDEPGVIRVSTRVQHTTREMLRRTYVDEGLEPGDYVVLEVSDTGQGMDAATRARVFDPFFTTKATGRGLGLAATLGIVRGHRGAIQLETEPGRGTTFRAFFPRGSRELAETSAPSSVERTAREGTVLVVDDEQLVRDVTRQMLESSGFTVLCATGGLDGIALFEAHMSAIDVVVLDMTMPDMSGDQVLSRLRRLKTGVRVVLCSGYSERDVAARIRADESCGFLQKPFSVNALVDKIQRVLAARDVPAS